MTKPELSTFNAIAPLIVQEYEHYLPTAFNEGMTLLQKLNKIIQYLNEIGKLSNDVIAKWNEVMEWIMEDGLNEAVSAKLEEMLLDGTLGDLINEVLLADIMNQLSDPRRFGAKGDGITDDTSAIQSLLNSPAKSINFRNGTFRITAGLTSSLAGRIIKSEGGVIKADTQDMFVLTVTGDNTKISLDIDGNNKGAIGVLINGAQGCEVKGCKIENLYGQFAGACAIKADTFKGVIIENNTINNINALGNATLGDNIGSSRGIMVTSTSPAMFLNVVQNNTIDKIIGEEGDAIQFLFYNGGSAPYLKAQGFVKGNTIRNCNRRAIKIQASDVRVINNEHMNTLLEAELPNSATLLDIIQSDDVFIEGNRMDASNFLGIGINGTTGYRAKRIVIKNNTIKGSASVKDCIFLSNVENVQVNNNVLHDGSRAIAMGNGVNVTFKDNILYGGIETSNGMNFLSDCSNLFITGNILLSGARLYMINNNAPNCIVENNHNHGLGATIRTYATSKGSIYRNNTNNNATTTVIGEFDDQYNAGARNTGSGSIGIGADIAFGSVAPISTIRHYNVGEIVFNTSPVAGGKIGWVCIGSGNPGTWKAFGVIDA